MSDEDKAVEFLLAAVEAQGVACATVDNGHMLLFKRATLQRILDQNPGKETLSIFIQRPIKN